MDLNELRKMTVPKLREQAKGIADLQGVGGMKKDQLIEAIAKSEGISYGSSAVPKDDTAIGSIKKEIRALRKQKEELLGSHQARHQVERVRRKIKRLKRLTRKMAREKAPQEASPPPAEASSSTPEAEPTPAPST
ncbi:MAG: Rho termination factor N-terminal domain-containing protein [Candidatus Binatia bacterium]